MIYFGERKANYTINVKTPFVFAYVLYIYYYIGFPSGLKWYKFPIYLIFYYYVIAGESREDVWLNKYFGGWNGSEAVGKRLMGVDQASFSDTNSEVSVSESVITNRSNLSISEEKEGETMGDKINMSFIDFIGVGTT